MLLESLAFVIYFSLIIAATLFTYRKQKSDTDFVIGDRSLSFWLTALSAHASDMSNWLFMAYPAIILTTGLFNIWVAIGLTVWMFINWQFIAPKIRSATGKYNNLTLNAYFESRFKDNTKSLRTISSIVSFIFFIFYISAGLVGMGYLIETLFHLHYIIGISLGLLLIVFYVFLGGYTTVAWLDLFQGFFLLGVIIIIPLYLIGIIGGFEPIISAIAQRHFSKSFFPSFSFNTILNIIFISCGWGLGYLGQPHIITKFMGIKHISEMKKAKYLGISWQILALGGATLFALVGIFLFPEGLSNPELIILFIVQKTLAPFFAGLVLCAILAATTNVLAAQILVVASSLSEDIYKRLFKPKASHRELLNISRASVILVSVIAYFIAFYKISTIYNLVLYSWSGLGSAFGPLIFISLYSKNINKIGAFFGIIIGAITSAIWPWINNYFSFIIIPPLIPGFALSTLFIFIASNLSKRKSYEK